MENQTIPQKELYQTECDNCGEWYPQREPRCPRCNHRTPEEKYYYE